MKPQLPIDVNEDTGVWTTDGLPMLYVPRHFFVNNHAAIESALGRDHYAEHLYHAGHKSAYFWCEKEAVTHNMSGLDVVEHYLKRLSQRGWGQFAFEHVDKETGSASISLNNSAFVLAQHNTHGKSCYMFSGWFSGAMDWFAHSTGRTYHTTSSETQCACEGSLHCVFSVKAK